MSKLAALVAVRVLGWTVRNDYGPRWSVPPESPFFRKWDDVHTDASLPFDTNIADAMEVFDKFTDAVLEKAGEGYEVTINAWAQGDNKNKCVAICLAALRAVGMTDAEIGEALR
jgi:hypothetical protein